jgi:hypothetical protein
MHRYGMAFDFRTPHKAAVVRWLAANNTGGTMTYRHSNHVHADVGRHFVALGGGGARRGRATRYANRTDRVAFSAVRRDARKVEAATPSMRYLVGNEPYAYPTDKARVVERRRERARATHGS